ncbi:uncharacterized, partial [Tachysurus ichikawai]
RRTDRTSALKSCRSVSLQKFSWCLTFGTNPSLATLMDTCQHKHSRHRVSGLSLHLGYSYIFIGWLKLCVSGVSFQDVHIKTLEELKCFFGRLRTEC